MRLLRTLFILCLVAALSGCYSGPIKLDKEEQELVYSDFNRNQKKLTYWQMEGRFNFRHDKQINSGNIRWVNNGDSYGIKFSGPLDQGAIVIASDGETVTLKDSKGYEGTASTPESMLSRYTQYEMPVSNLQYWLVGLPAPHPASSVKLNPQGYPMLIQQGPWSIEYQYLHDVDEYLLPGKIIITHPNMKITLSIHEWQTSEKPYLDP